MKKIHVLALIPVLCLVVRTSICKFGSLLTYGGCRFYYFGYYYQCSLRLFVWVLCTYSILLIRSTYKCAFCIIYHYLFLFLALFLGIRAQHGKDIRFRTIVSVGGKENLELLSFFSLWQGKFIQRFHIFRRKWLGFFISKGFPTFYILGYGALAYVLSYFLLPPNLEVCKRT